MTAPTLEALAGRVEEQALLLSDEGANGYSDALQAIVNDLRACLAELERDAGEHANRVIWMGTRIAELERELAETRALWKADEDKGIARESELERELATARATLDLCAANFDRAEAAEARLAAVARVVDEHGHNYCETTGASPSRARAGGDVMPAEPIPILLWCPLCSGRHIDEGEFATKPHHTHACQHCGHVWRPAIVPTCGVQFLPGFKND